MLSIRRLVSWAGMISLQEAGPLKGDADPDAGVLTSARRLFLCVRKIGIYERNYNRAIGRFSDIIIAMRRA